MNDSEHEAEEAEHQAGEVQGDAEVVAPWVVEVEELYISRRLPSLRAAAHHAGASTNTVFAIARARNWNARRAAASQEAAKKLAAQIDERAAQRLADIFSSMEQDVIAAGQLHARMVRLHAASETERAVAAKEKGDRVLLSSPPKASVEIIELAFSLRPQLAPGASDGVVQLQTMVEKMLADERGELMSGEEDEAFDFSPAAAALPEGKS